jgi:uncharacterized membrane protein
VASIVGLLHLFWMPLILPTIAVAYTPRDLLLVLAVGFFEAVYVTGLAGGYRSGNLSLVYPLARSIPAVAVTIGSVLLGRSEEIHLLCWVGVVLIVIDCIFLPLKRFSDIHIERHLTGIYLRDHTCCFGIRSRCELCFCFPPVEHPMGVTIGVLFFKEPPLPKRVAH